MLAGSLGPNSAGMCGNPASLYLRDHLVRMLQLVTPPSVTRRCHQNDKCHLCGPCCYEYLLNRLPKAQDSRLQYRRVGVMGNPQVCICPSGCRTERGGDLVPVELGGGGWPYSAKTCSVEDLARREGCSDTG